MKRSITLTIGLVSILFFTACKKEASVNIDQNRIYSDYEVTYDQFSNKTTTQAMFRVDNKSGKKIELTYPARVGFNDETLEWKNLGGSYQSSFVGNQLNGSFTYIDGVNYENGGAYLNPIDLPFGMNNISKSGNFFLPWSGAPLQQGETVEVIINGGSQSGTERFNASVVGASYISLSQFKLDDLEVGTARIQIIREKTVGIEQSTLAGGQITARYKGRKITVNITE